MSSSAESLVRIVLLSSIASADGALDAGRILAVRADVAAAWIADGLARAVVGTDAAPARETTMREPGRARQAAR
jgi:hypothetical protein